MKPIEKTKNGPGQEQINNDNVENLSVNCIVALFLAIYFHMSLASKPFNSCKKIVSVRVC